MNWVRTRVFRFWENRLARNWGLTAGFLLVALVGARFAGFAWLYGNAADRVAVVVAGAAMGAIGTVVVFRIWHVPPVRTIRAHEHPAAELPRRKPAGPEFWAASQFAHSKSAHNMNLAAESAALGRKKRAPF
jgi:hypothetical protein